MIDLKHLRLTRVQMAQHFLVDAEGLIDYGSHLPTSDGLLVAARFGHETLGIDGCGATLILSGIE